MNHMLVFEDTELSLSVSSVTGKGLGPSTMARLVVLSKIAGLSELISKHCAHLSCASHMRVDAHALKALGTAEIALAEPSMLAEALAAGGKPRELRWVQSTFAGVNQLAAANRAFRLTRIAGLFGPDMAEYCLMHILARERQLNELCVAQGKLEWKADGYSYRKLSDLKISILGLGDIGSVIASTLRACGCTSISGLVTNVAGRSNMSGIALHTQLKDALADCDYIINTLPSTPSTAGLLDGSVLSQCSSSSPVLINIGRGDIISETSLLTALQSKWLSGAVLDVFPEEPLPSSSPLWSTPGVTITPHVAAKSTAAGVMSVFMQNLELYEQGLPLLHEVDWAKGY
jgi:phosphoglycerate dehydrogenase-like enzyme